MTTPSSPSFPLLSLSNARIDRDGAPLCEQLSMQADGDRVVLTGVGAEAICDAVTNAAVVAEGRLAVDGFDIAKGEHIGRVGVAPLDPPLPPRMNVRGYVELSLRTAGADKKTSAMVAQAILADLGLSELGNRRTESLAVPERRATMIAAAMVPSSRTVVIQAPLAGLEGPACHYILSVLGQLSKRRRVLATALRFDAAGSEHDLIMGATHVCLIDHHHVLWTGTPTDWIQQGPWMIISIRGDNLSAFMQALQVKGFTPHGAPPRFALSRPAHATTTDLLTIADETHTAILEMMPLVLSTPGVGQPPEQPPVPSEPALDPTAPAKEPP